MSDKQGSFIDTSQMKAISPEARSKQRVLQQQSDLLEQLLQDMAKHQATIPQAAILQCRVDTALDFLIPRSLEGDPPQDEGDLPTNPERLDLEIDFVGRLVEGAKSALSQLQEDKPAGGKKLVLPTTNQVADLSKKRQG